jgi:hypothetical protein
MDLLSTMEEATEEDRGWRISDRQQEQDIIRLPAKLDSSGNVMEDHLPVPVGGGRSTGNVIIDGEMRILTTLLILDTKLYSLERLSVSVLKREPKFRLAILSVPNAAGRARNSHSKPDAHHGNPRNSQAASGLPPREPTCENAGRTEQ